jgi:hypothetical protein
MTAKRSSHRAICSVGQMKRSYIEVEYRSGDGDPIGEFASLLREKHGASEETEEYNRRLIENLVQKGQIPKSSIIWYQDKITKIYGFKVDDTGKILYDLTGSHSPNRRAKAYVTNAPNIDMSAVRNAILRSKQTPV